MFAVAPEKKGREFSHSAGSQITKKKKGNARLLAKSFQRTTRTNAVVQVVATGGKNIDFFRKMCRQSRLLHGKTGDV